MVGTAAECQGQIIECSNRGRLGSVGNEVRARVSLPCDGLNGLDMATNSTSASCRVGLRCSFRVLLPRGRRKSSSELGPPRD